MSQEIVLASNALAQRLGVEKGHMLATIKAQCFKCDPEKVSDTQLAAFVSIAHDMGVNPLLPGMLYAFPDGRGGIVPMMGPDGVMKKLSEMKGVTYECIVYPEDVTQPPTHATAKIYVEGKERPYTYTAVYSEWATSNWGKKPRHWNWLRALKQCARQVIHGLPMDEEEITLGGMVNVTDTAPEPAPERPKPPARRGGAAAAMAATETPAADPKPEPKKDAAPTIEAEIVDADPADDEAAKKAEREATEKALKEREAKLAAAKAAAEAEAKAKAEAAKPAAPDLSAVPEVCPGVSITSFKGKSWPCPMNATIKAVTAVTAAKPYLKLTVTTHSPAEAEITVATYEHVEVKDGKAEITAAFVAVGQIIEFSAEAKLMPSKNPDPANPAKKLPDLTKPPAIMAIGITEAALEV
jgi:hypothetical protein